MLALRDVNTLNKKSEEQPPLSDNSWNVTWHTVLEYYPTASLWAIGWVLTFSFHGLGREWERASCHTGGNPKINVATGSQPSSPLHWKWDLSPSQRWWIECTLTAVQLPLWPRSSGRLQVQKRRELKMRCLLLLEFLWWEPAEIFALVHERNTRHKAITLLCTVISCFLEFFFLMFFFSSSVGDKYRLNAVSLIRASPVTLSVTSA